MVVACTSLYDVSMVGSVVAPACEMITSSRYHTDTTEEIFLPLVLFAHGAVLFPVPALLAVEAYIFVPRATPLRCGHAQ
jgi:hypothetical protein